MKLSGAVPTRDGAARLPALLPDLCALCDEVVVLVDSLTTDDTIEVARRYTDRVYVVSHDDDSANMQLAALEHASGDWILRITDDETLSPQWRRERVDPLLASRTFTHVGTPTRWLVPPGDRAISAGRWYPQYEMRLYRNIPSIAVFGTSAHDRMTIAGEELRVADLHVYRRTLAIDDRAARRERVEFARRIDTGFPYAEWYLYEDEFHEIAPFDDSVDRPLVEHLPGPPLDSPHTIDMRLSEVPTRMAAGESYPIRVEIANRTNRTLSAPRRHLGESDFAIGYHWFDGDGALVQFAPEELPLFATLEPLEVRAAYITVRAPYRPGRHAIACDLLERGITWFSQSFAAGEHPAVPVDVEVPSAFEATSSR